MSGLEMVQVVVCAGLGWRSLVTINSMDSRTHHGIRVIHLTLATFCAWVCIAPFFTQSYGQVPTVGTLTTFLLLELFDRRRPRL